MLGKLSPEELRKFVFSRLGKEDKSVVMGPKYGEDTAALKINEKILVINTDPIVFAADRIGILGIHIAANDIAASGAKPRWLTNTFFLPKKFQALDKITKDLHKEAKKLDISIIGGHSEYTPEISRPFISMTCMGLTDNYIPTGGAKPGDKVILTKGCAIEATGILATDFESRLKNKLPKKTIEKAKSFLSQISVLKEASILSKYSNSMHDPTEGGITNGLFEIASASGVSLEIHEHKILVPKEAREVCKVFDINPLKVFSSGALLATVPSKKSKEALSKLKKNKIKAAIIGKVKEFKEPTIKINKETFKKPARDQLYHLWD